MTSIKSNEPDIKKGKTRKVFDQRPDLVILRFFFYACRLLPSRITSWLALQVFLYPLQQRPPEWEIDLRKEAKQISLINGKNKFFVYQWGDTDKKVLLCHAWGGRGTQLGKFIKPLLDNGYTVISFDAPAHGQSPGKFTNMVEYVTTIELIAKKYGSFYAAIGHSFGAANLLWACQDFGFRAEKIALIGCFIHGQWIIEAFGQAIRLPIETVRKMEDILERKYSVLHFKKLSMVEFMKNVAGDVLLVHDEKDLTVPYSHAQELLNAANANLDVNATLYTTLKKGHIKIVKVDAVIDKVTDFITN